VRCAVREYVDERGQIPFRDWLVGLDLATRARVQARILRFETGNLGDHKDVGGGVWEARLRAKVFWSDYLKEMRDGKTR
jgi:putative component of toxin-antitoxin plasmid stabilization module